MLLYRAPFFKCIQMLLILPIAKIENDKDYCVESSKLLVIYSDIYLWRQSGTLMC